MIRKLFILCCLLVLSSSLAGANKLKIEQFISPETCGDCHTTIYEQWSNSMHHQAHFDPIYVPVSQFLRKGLKDKGEIAEAESCVKCHTPVGNITGYPLKTSDNRKKVQEIATQGIQCDYCHSATGSTKDYNNGLTIAPGEGEDNPGVKRGPFKDSESDFHGSAYSEFHTKSGICGTCHDVKHVTFGTVLESTYTEWKKSPYNSRIKGKTINCQDCHMYQRPGIPATASTKRPKNKGKAADEGPVREHIFTHYFVGGNAQIPGLAGDTIKAKMATERLQNAAELNVDASNLKKGALRVTITNSGAGHYLPTGLTDIRQMWLEVIIRNAAGKTIYASGMTDKNGYIPTGTKLYCTVFGNGKGKVVLNIAKAKEIISDNRIPPLKSTTETFQFKTKEKGKLSVSVRLLYRSASQKLVDTVLGKGKMKLSTLEMEKTVL